MVADNPEEKIELKAFSPVENEQANYKELPQFLNVENKDILANYLQVKNDVAMILQTEI